jgi:GMP reductase
MIIEHDIKLDFNDVLFKPQRSTLSSRNDVDIEREIKFRNSGRIWKGIPIISANMDTTGTFELGAVLKEYNMITALHKHYTIEEWKKNIHLFFPNNMAVTIGIKDEDYDKFLKIQSIVDVHFLVIDVANGYSERFINFVSMVRKRHPKLTIIAGNVVSSDITQELILNGADIVKVGIGSGASCLTRLQTGVGIPQLSTVIECSNAAHGLDGHIMSDGGCVYPGDISKAFGAGADFVMIGSMFAGHDESGGGIITEFEHDGYIWSDGQIVSSYNEKEYKTFYGMSSTIANKKYAGGLRKYRSSEGRETKVPYRGPVSETIKNILGGLRSTMTYIGARRLKDVPKCTTFVRVNNTHNKVLE